jgi:hypothetical protein
VSANAEEAKLKEFGYTQKLDRSVGKIASFCIGFSVISATTAVFSGFGVRPGHGRSGVHLDLSDRCGHLLPLGRDRG